MNTDNSQNEKKKKNMQIFFQSKHTLYIGGKVVELG